MNMQLSEPIRNRIAKEFRFVADGMAANSDLPVKLYFFSAFYAELQRMLNQSWSADLVLAHLVLKETHQQINGRLSMPVPTGGIPTGFSDALDQIANDLADLFAREQIDESELYKLLARAAELGYAVTGNGFYLYLKGEIKIGAETTALPPPAAQSPDAAPAKASRRGRAHP